MRSGFTVGGSAQRCHLRVHLVIGGMTGPDRIPPL